MIRDQGQAKPNPDVTGRAPAPHSYMVLQLRTHTSSLEGIRRVNAGHVLIL